MMSEFIELTGFEPTGEEYRQIEGEYMGCNEDKQKFCKKWVKNGGIQRLSRQRVRRIEQLEAEVKTNDRKFEEILLQRNATIAEYRRASEASNKAIDNKNEEIKHLEAQLSQITQMYNELKNAIKIIKEVA